MLSADGKPSQTGLLMVTTVTHREVDLSYLGQRFRSKCLVYVRTVNRSPQRFKSDKLLQWLELEGFTDTAVAEQHAVKLSKAWHCWGRVCGAWRWIRKEANNFINTDRAAEAFKKHPALQFNSLCPGRFIIANEEGQSDKMNIIRRR